MQKIIYREKRILLFLVLNSFLYGGCTSKEERITQIAENAYREVVGYVLAHSIDESSGCYIGAVRGSANLRIKSKSFIEVTYSALGMSATETGDLMDLNIKNSCGLQDSTDFYPISISGTWNCRTSGSGSLVVTIEKDNTVWFYIFGSSWEYWKYYKMESVESIIAIFNNALEEKAKLTGEEVRMLKYLNPEDFHKKATKKELVKICRWDQWVLDIQLELMHSYGMDFYIEDDMVGVVDASGYRIIEAKYKCLEVSENGKYFRALNNDGYGIIDIAGNVVVPLKYGYVCPANWGNLEKGEDYNIFDESDPYLLVRSHDGYYGVFNSKGDVIADINSRYKRISSYDKIYCISDTGADIITPETAEKIHIDCDDLFSSCEGQFCCIKKGGKYGIIDNTGKEIFPCIYDDIPNQISDSELYTLPKDNTIPVVVKNDGYFGLICYDGTVVIPFNEYNYIDSWGKGFLVFKGQTSDTSVYDFNGNWSYFLNGDLVICDKKSYSEISEAVERLLCDNN